MSRHFLFEEKEYKISPYFKRAREGRDSAQELARLLRRFTGKSGTGGRTGDRGQKCVIKMQYSNSIEAHRVQVEKYLTREGTDKDLTNGAALFGTDTEEYKNNMVSKNFRIFLSPQSSKMDLKELTEKFVSRLELQTGHKLYWQGACHYNTAHPHAHLLINGVDKNGRNVKFSRDVVKTFMRETARSICTARLGFRTQKDLDIEKEAALSAPRWTALDSRINLLSRDNKINLNSAGTERLRFLARLENLRKLNLCKYQGGCYVMKKDWEENLRANGRYNIFLKAREELTRNNAESLKIYTGDAGAVRGRVTKIYRVDGDASDNHAVVLESPNGKSYFIPLLKKPEKINEGELARVWVNKNSKGRLSPVIIKEKEYGKENTI